MMVTFWGPVTLTHYYRAWRRGAVTTCFEFRLRSVAAGIEHPTFRLRGQRPNPLPRRRGLGVSGFYRKMYNF